MLEKIKQHLFSLDGIIGSFIHGLMLAGVIFMFLFYHWLSGNVDFSISMAAITQGKHK